MHLGVSPPHGAEQGRTSDKQGVLAPSGRSNSGTSWCMHCALHSTSVLSVPPFSLSPPLRWDLALHGFTPILRSSRAPGVVQFIDGHGCPDYSFALVALGLLPADLRPLISGTRSLRLAPPAY
jgi:hypothetical protein